MPDYEQCISKLIARLKLMHGADWSPTPEAKALDALANKLDEVIAMMDEDTYWDLEDSYNQPTPGYIRHDGSRDPDIERAGFYANIRWNMYELAEFARRKKQELPHPNKKNELPFAAMGLLHILYHSGRERPSLYANSAGVKELGRVCAAANIHLSPETLRGALKTALASFDPLDIPDGIEEILFDSQ